MAHPLKNVLNRLRWDKEEDPRDYLITYRHRGAPEDVKRIKASHIKRLGKSFFTIHDADAADETVIPFHRILEIRNIRDGAIVWIKRSRKQSPGNSTRA